MGLRNLTERSRSRPGPVEKLGFFGIVKQLIRKNRDLIDFNGPVKLGRFSLTTNVSNGTEEREVELPEASHRITTNVLAQIRDLGLIKGIRKSQPHAHEYLGNPQILALLTSHSLALEEWKQTPWEARYPKKKAEIRMELGGTLSQLATAKLHLYHRKQQREADPKLEALFRSIDEDLIPQVEENQARSLEYWM